MEYCINWIIFQVLDQMRVLTEKVNNMEARHDMFEAMIISIMENCIVWSNPTSLPTIILSHQLIKTKVPILRPMHTTIYYLIKIRVLMINPRPIPTTIPTINSSPMPTIIRVLTLLLMSVLMNKKMSMINLSTFLSYLLSTPHPSMRKIHSSSLTPLPIKVNNPTLLSFPLSPSN